MAVDNEYSDQSSANRTRKIKNSTPIIQKSTLPRTQAGKRKVSAIVKQSEPPY